MDSINRQQVEANHADIFNSDAVKKMKSLCEKKSCFFCTGVGKGQLFRTRPMSVQKVDDKGILWFLSAVDSHKNSEILADPRVELLFQGSSHSEFVTLSGSAYVSKDSAIIKALWEPIMKTWFTDGEDDARITVIRVLASEGYYWDTKHGAAVAFAKQLVGAALGKTMDDSVEGRLSL